MKKAFIVSMTIAAMSFTTLSKADVMLHTFLANSCEDLVGNWVGSAKVTSWTIGQCIYRGNGNVQSIDKSGNFALYLKVNKESGSVLCPTQAEKIIPGNCLNNKVTLQTNYGNITGSIAGTVGSATGTLQIMFGVTADVVIGIRKV